MDNSDIKDPLFREAVNAIDSGNISSLQHLLNKNPKLISKRLDTPTDGYFKHPYLMWFVADNPIRHEQLPKNILELTRLLIDAARIHSAGNFQEQINYTLGLVATGRIPRESGVQNEWIDLLIDNGSPLDWAKYMQTEEADELKKKKYAEIGNFLNDFSN